MAERVRWDGSMLRTNPEHAFVQELNRTERQGQPLTNQKGMGHHHGTHVRARGTTMWTHRLCSRCEVPTFPTMHRFDETP